MHFVKKVPTTEEERQIREKERLVKQKTFIFVKNKVFEKSEKDEYDDEILEFSEKLLSKNPDIYSFWTIRRKAIERLVEQQNKQTSEEETTTINKKIEAVLTGELYLTQKCLEENPKSYSAWFHRGWILHKQQQPNIQHELKLCEKALKLDCRNFHCWDYRRLVVQLGNVSDDDELKFSDSLISSNFSNFSAWHYRVTLLRRVKNQSTDVSSFKMDDETLKEELEKVKSAFYTDPDDQSAWVYTRWLLDVSSDQEWLRPDTHLAPVPLTAVTSEGLTTIVMSNACSRQVLETYIDCSEDSHIIPFSAHSIEPSAARVWQVVSTEGVKICQQPGDQQYHDLSDKHYVNQDMLKQVFNAVPRCTNTAIIQLTDDCKQLLELEPENTWALMMYTQCLLATSLSSHQLILDNLRKLAEKDAKRSKLYNDMISRELINQYLTSQQQDGKSILESLMSQETTSLAIRNKQLTSLDGIEFLASFVTDLDVSGNLLTNFKTFLLPRLHQLTVSENLFTELPLVPALSNLHVLIAACCPIQEADDVIPSLQAMKNLERFIFCEGALAEKANCDKLRQSLPQVCLIPHWL